MRYGGVNINQRSHSRHPGREEYLCIRFVVYLPVGWSERKSAARRRYRGSRGLVFMNFHPLEERKLYNVTSDRERRAGFGWEAASEMRDG